MNHNKCVCPFHNDNHPSMSVKPQKNIATCFSCGVTGNVISFVQKYEKLVNNNPITLNETLMKVVEICNLKIDVSKLKNKNDNRRYFVASRNYTLEQQELLKVNEFLNSLFVYNLKASKEPKQYLYSRDINDKDIEEMSMGYAVKGQLLNASNNNTKAPLSALLKLEYLKYDDNGNLYETFSDRIMIPIHDEKGNIVTFCGRTIKDEDPKYLHTPETDIFKKKELLFNFYNAKSQSYNNELILVEGYMDVLGAKKVGYGNVAAIMGTALTEEQIKLIKYNKASITLALDNDKAGRDAMIRYIPDLLKNGFRVNVLDISKLADYKDFGDLGQNNVAFVEVQKMKVSGFSYLLDYKYFKDLDLNVDNISSIYKTLKQDKLMNNTLDESKFKEYLLERTDFTKNELDEIMYPKKIQEKENSISNFASKAMSSFLYTELQKEIEKIDDVVLTTYYNGYKESVESRLVLIFNQKPDSFLDYKTSTLNTELLLKEFIKDNKEYLDFELLNRFKYKNVFDKTFIKNSNGSARIRLNEEQRQQVITQFENTLTDKDKLSLEEVEELYIVNNIEDIDGILNYDTTKLNILKDNIKDRLIINPGKMDFFKFGSLFLNEKKEFIDSSFKGRTGNYKTILFYNNLSNDLNLDKDNVLLNQEIKEIEEISYVSHDNSEKEHIYSSQNDFIFSVNKMLVLHETDSHYFVRIPNTSAKEYFYISKDECEWTANRELFYSKLRYGQDYPIYDKEGNYIEDKSFSQLKRCWEDKTKTTFLNDNIQSENQISGEMVVEKQNTQNDFVFNNDYVSRYQEPICKVYKSKIYLETEKGFYIKTDDPSILIFAIKKICKWNDDKSYLIIYPRKSKFVNTGISKYTLDGFKKEFQDRLNYNEIDKYLKVFYPKDYNKKIVNTFEVPKNKCEFVSNFIKIPITIENVDGYIQVNIVKSKINAQSIIIEFSENEVIGFHDKNGKCINHYGYEVISDSYNKTVLNNNVIQFPIDDLNNKELEKEAA